MRRRIQWANVQIAVEMSIPRYLKTSGEQVLSLGPTEVISSSIAVRFRVRGDAC